MILVDVEDRHLLEEPGWYVAWSRNRPYVCRVVKAGGRRTQEKLHRRILNAAPGVQVDHINGDGLDNRRCNLREATHSQNQQNRGKNRNNSTGFKGVDFVKHRGKFRARIMANRVLVSLGADFATAEEAHAAYCEAAKRLHRRFANTGEGV